MSAARKYALADPTALALNLLAEKIDRNDQRQRQDIAALRADITDMRADIASLQTDSTHMRA
ncbi:MAG: hypothetical protein WCK65_12245, partial [Rhodospirillaceae bacterium]